MWVEIGLEIENEEKPNYINVDLYSFAFEPGTLLVWAFRIVTCFLSTLHFLVSLRQTFSCKDLFQGSRRFKEHLLGLEQKQSNSKHPFRKLPITI